MNSDAEQGDAQPVLETDPSCDTRAPCQTKPVADQRQGETLGALGLDALHEFSNLMTIVLGSLQQLARQSLDARGREQLERAEGAARQAAEVVLRRGGSRPQSGA